MNKELLKGQSELIVLAALADRPMHGYALSEYIRDEMGQAFKFGVGMLYPLLHRLEQKKLVEGKWQEVAGLKRRVYCLTKAGKKAYTAKKKEWASFSSLVGQMVKLAI